MPVLVVEDDAALRKLFREGITRDGYEVETAADGVTALDAVRGRPPALILLDLGIASADGGAFTRAYRDLPGPHAPIIAVGGAVDAEEAAAAIQADDLLDKPFRLEELRAVITRYFGLFKPSP
jgi:two-component system KDP operon response regulator KdpE